MMPRASIAGSFMQTQVGFGVMTCEMTVELGSMFLATTLLVMSVSVMMPASPPAAFTTNDASPRLFANICVTVRILSSSTERSGFFGRSFETGRSSFFTTEALDATVRLPLSTEATSETSSRSIALLKIERQPSAPPQPLITSMTSTRPTTVPSDSQTGRVRNLWSCIA